MRRARADGTAGRHPVSTLVGRGESTRLRPLAEPKAAAGGRADLVQEVQNQEHLAWAAQQARDYVISNNDWRDSIKHQGVMTEVWLAATTFQHLDSSPSVTVPVTAEGSSRVTCVHDLLDLRSAEVPYDRDERRFRTHIRKLNEDIAAAGTDHDPRTHEAVHVAITSQSTRKKTSPKLLFDLATSLVLRSVPEEDTRRRERIRRYLKEGFSNELAKEEWEATFRSAEELAAAALSEAESGIPGPATRELAARSAYPLVVSGQLLDRSRDLDQPDRRKPGEVINRMRATPDGVYQLRQVLVDAAGGRRIRMVDTTGQVERNAEGRDIIAKDIDLRRRFHAPGEGSERTPPPGTPAELLGNTLNTLGNAVRAVETAVKEIEAVESDDGTPAIDSLGADKQDCDAWQVILFAALQKLAIWSNRSIQRHGPSHDDDLDLDDDEGARDTEVV